jgi:hypothetical protein
MKPIENLFVYEEFPTRQEIENLFVYEEFPTRQEIKNNHMKYKKDLFLEKFKKITNK